jgi:hypothetical protein
MVEEALVGVQKIVEAKRKSRFTGLLRFFEKSNVPTFHQLQIV